MISGDTIVVAENQFFDFWGFIETFDELFHAAKETNLKANLPIKVALRDKKVDVFQVVAKSIGNEKFDLTLWKDLEGQVDRRKLWAESFRNKQRPNTEIVLEEEKKLLDKLWTVLEYFTPDHQCVEAKNIPEEFYKRINRVLRVK